LTKGICIFGIMNRAIDPGIDQLKLLSFLDRRPALQVPAPVAQILRASCQACIAICIELFLARHLLLHTLPFGNARGRVGFEFEGAEHARGLCRNDPFLVFPGFWRCSRCGNGKPDGGEDEYGESEKMLPVRCW